MHDTQPETQPNKKHTMLKFVGLAIAAAGVFVAKKIMMKSPKEKKDDGQEKSS